MLKCGYIIMLYLVIVLFTILSPVFCLAQTTEDEIPDISQRINTFTMDWMRYCSKDPAASANMIVSPLGIFDCLAASYIASGGNTRTELAQIFHYPADNETLLNDLTWLRKLFDKSNVMDRIEIVLASSAWLDKTYADFQDEFLRTVQDAFLAELFEIEFRPAEAACDQINRWITEKTRGRIPGHISPDDLPSKSRPGVIDEPALVTINTIYFKGDWVYKFDKGETRKKLFHVDSSTKVDTDMMYQRSRLSYSEDDTAQFLEIPYLNRNFFMFIILPKEIVSVSSMAEWMDPDRIMAIIQKGATYEVDLLFPKFMLRSHFNCKKDLNSLGVKDAFNNETADFDKMIHRNIKADRIYLHEVLQDTWIEVNEKGTEMVAATMVFHHSYTVGVEYQPPFVRFHADHPFLFLIIHNPSKSILSSGWISDPGDFMVSKDSDR